MVLNFSMLLPQSPTDYRLTLVRLFLLSMKRMGFLGNNMKRWSLVI